jgi:hypothetical protein
MASGQLRLHYPVQLLSELGIGNWVPQIPADIGDSLVLVKQLFGGAQIADDLYSFGEALATGIWRLHFMGTSPCQFGQQVRSQRD